MKHLVFALLALALSTTGCEHQPDETDPADRTPTEEPDGEPDKTIEDDDPEVNDPNDLEQNDDETCPPPRQTDEMCAQVVVWALSPDGHCCEYPTPCHAPKAWETFHSADDCRAAAEGGDSTE